MSAIFSKLTCSSITHCRLFTCCQFPKYLSTNNIPNSNILNIIGKSPEIIIIGSGLSGLSAADSLIENGFTNLKILEASNRYGGRIYTKKFGDAICELGAKWIYKNNLSNSFYNLIENDANKMLYFLDYHKKYFITSVGDKISPAVTNKVSKEFNEILKKTAKMQNKNFINSKNNSKAFLETESEKLTKILFKKDSQEASKIFNALINDFGSFFGCDLSRVHISQLSKISPFFKHLITTNNGMINVIQPMINRITLDKIEYGKPVGQIKWSKTKPLKKVDVFCLDGSILSADHVICTIPLGVLKKFAPYLFQPLLSKEKLMAISKIGLSTPGQFYLKYKKNVNEWLTLKSIVPAWSSTELNDHNKLSRHITEISIIPKSKFVVEVKRLGNEEFERLSDNEIISDTTKLLRLLLKNSNIPYANDLIRSTWGTDTKFLGGLPYLRKPHSEKYIKYLSRPCGPYVGDSFNKILKIQFAGDATDWKGFGTLDGARRSGIREAKRIVDFYKTNF